MSRINTNVPSLIAQRVLGNNNSSLNQALVRLSTGLRINSGRDDPAGLIASETLRSSIRAVGQAISNATRADTIVTVAEGGLQEISSLLLDLEALVGQSSNEAGLTPDEVSANQLQIDSILASINRISDSTAFGNKKLLNGNLAFTTSGVNVNEATGAALNYLDKVTINASKIPPGGFRQVTVKVVTRSQLAYISAVGAGTTGAGVRNGTIARTTTVQVKGNLGSEIISFASGTSTTDIATRINQSKDLTGVSATASASGTGPKSLLLQSTTYGLDAFVSVSVLENVSTAFTAQAADVTDFGVDGTVTINGANAIVDGLDASVQAGSLALDLTLTPSFGGTTGSQTSFEILGGGAIFQISPDLGLTGRETIGITELSTAKLGSKGTGFLTTLASGLGNDLQSRKFSTAQRIVRESINQVASLRGRLGAFQKDILESTINSLGVALENVTAAESAIRDADFAVETASLTRAQILVNSATSVLQIANAQPQNALALLGG
ncbi:MAG: flagellin [Planctomycetota bacterium]